MPARAGWVLMEAPAAIVPVVAYVHLGGTLAGAGAWLLALWELHYLQRAAVFPFLLRGEGKRAPLLTVGLGLAFNVVNGLLNGAALVGWRPHALLVPGVALFLAGLAINLHSDAVLRALRAPGESGYRIPRGGLFRWVSSANYLGELLEWTGFALAALTPAAAAFALFTAANLVPRAVTHHRWYRARFPDYPAERKAILPYLL
jgi:3-oxo-5-alpha-steroid 4-dehydrogenase 1